ncbi:MAG: universal stress protein, partial [Thermoleophilia bacterium]
KAASFAIGLAKSCDAELHVVSVVDIGSPRTAMEIDQDYTEELKESIDVGKLEDERKKVESQIVDHVNKMASAEGVEVSGSVRVGHPSEEILKHAQETDSDLIVMGSHGRRGLTAAVMGSVSTNVIHEGSFPVLVVPE